MFPGDKNHYRLADLGCLEGGFAVEFARMGFQVLGIEVREANMAACNYVKANTNLPNLEFIKDDARNIAKYGVFDVVFCCGLLYHLDKPKEFLNTLSAVTTKLLILQTHFSTDTKKTDTKNKEHRPSTALPRWSGIARKLLARVKRHDPDPADKFNLSELTENETLRGRWYTELRTMRHLVNETATSGALGTTVDLSGFNANIYSRQYMMLASISSWNSSIA